MNNLKSGIYKITNLTNGKYYIGSSVNIISRFAVHKHYLLNGNHRNAYLQNAWNKYGKNNFIFSIILLCHISQLHFFEQCAINWFESYKRNYGYNLDRIVHGVIRHSAETKRKIRESNIGKSTKGWKHSEETKLKISAALKGKNTWTKGRKHNLKTREKISKALIGHEISDETAMKISIANKGHTCWCKGMKLGPISEETRMKLSASRKGKKFTKEHKAKLSIIAKNRKRDRDGKFSKS